MRTKRRDQQNLNLTKDTHRTSNSIFSGQRENKSGQLDMFPSWEVRIGSRAHKKTSVFNNLMKHINRDTLHQAYKAVDGSKALGIDGISKCTFGKNLESNIDNLNKRVQDGTYRPQPKREVLRYADDAVFFFNKEDDVLNFKSELKKRVQQFGPRLNEEKTKMIKLDKSSKQHFHFLGFTFYWGKQGSRRVFKVKTQKEKLLKAIMEFDCWVKINRSKYKLKELWKIARSKILGNFNYYGFFMNNLKINHFLWRVTKSLFKWLNRRSQKLSYSPEGFDERLKNFPLLEEFDKLKWKQLGRSFGRI